MDVRHGCEDRCIPSAQLYFSLKNVCCRNEQMNHSLCPQGTSGGGKVMHKGDYNYNARQKAFNAARERNSSQPGLQ